MQINSIIAKNYGPFRRLDETRFDQFSLLIGKNDSGKSSILKALKLFIEDKSLQKSDLHHGADEDIIQIEVSFISQNNIQFENDIDTTLKEEHLTDKNGYLRIRKYYNAENNFKPETELIVYDFDDNNYSGLINLKESQLNTKCNSLGIEVSPSGRSVTNKSKREKIRSKANELGIPLVECSLKPDKSILKIINRSLPLFDLFETDTKLGVNETTFQNQFNSIIKNATENSEVIEARNALESTIENALQNEVNLIFDKFKEHNQEFNDFQVQSNFFWEKAVKFDIIGKDIFSVEKSIDDRGSGIRRLLMVSFFQYMAENKKENNKLVFAIEEPENSLHPGLQRELFNSLNKIAGNGHQIIVTSHSPVFAGSADMSGLTLIVRNEGIAEAKQSSDFDEFEIARELGVDPSDQITSYNACVFVEGQNDVEFFNEIASKMKDGGLISDNFKDKNIGFIIYGGANLKHFVDANALIKLNKKYGVIIDSDRTSESQDIPQKKLNWKDKCESEGGKFSILKKREIENYICPEIILSKRGKEECYDDFSDMKKMFGENVYKLIYDMSLEQIKEMDSYLDEYGNEHNELIEIVNDFLSLA